MAPWPRSTVYSSSPCSPPASAAVGGPAWVGPPPTTAGEVLRGARLLRCFAPRDPALSSTALTALQLADRCASKFEGRDPTGRSSRRDPRLSPTHVRRGGRPAGRDKLSARLWLVSYRPLGLLGEVSRRSLFSGLFRVPFLCPARNFTLKVVASGSCKERRKKGASHQHANRSELTTARRQPCQSLATTAFSHN